MNRLAAFVRPHQGKYVLSVLLAIGAVLCGFVPYVAASVMVAGLLAGKTQAGLYVLWCAIAVLGHVAKALLAGASTLVSHKATFAVLSEVRRALATKLDRVPLGYVINTPSGALKTAFVERTEQLEVPLSHIVPELTANLLVSLGIVIYLFALDWRMALASLVTIPIGIVAYMIGMRNYAEKYGRVVKAKKHMGATIVEYIGGIEVIKAFGRTASSYRALTDAVLANSGLMLDWMRATLPWTSIMMNVWPAVLIGVLPVGCLLTINGTLPAATFVTVIILSLGIIEPLFTAILFTSDMSKISTVVAELHSVLDQAEMNRPTQPVELNGYDIVMKDVEFSYDDKPVLKGVTLTVAAGKVTALVGPSGSGKSTIARLIASQWEATGGTMTVGQRNIRDIPISQIAQTTAYVAQDNYLFNDTVMNNIRIGKPSATDQEVIATAQASGCHDFIMGLTDGYYTRVGFSGGHLSGGERQRIAIARAMMKDAPIIILDEATAYTDPENEAVIQDAVSRLARGKTMIVIAHRLSTVIDADAIAVVDDGRVIACDTHDNLLANCPLYARMWDAHESARDMAPGAEEK
ncbi:ABC transporter ATP-binding protein [Schaalia sp. ZJ1691]|uniref:ABC transporter ATP-binding protein n=1 Tax=Schaalia sp. ZJ1691 TaxID=2709404 RepID=UPI0019820860|nr:ABC transporter ATP-binding protein [Schaalia sp. ZJ1691]